MLIKTLTLIWLLVTSTLVDAEDKVHNKYYCHINYYRPVLNNKIACTELLGVIHRQFTFGSYSKLFLSKVDQTKCEDMDELSQTFIKAYAHFVDEAAHGAVSEPFLNQLDARLKQCSEDNNYQRLLDIKNSTHSYSNNLERSLIALAVKRHAVSLRILGHVFQLGIGVKVNLSFAWAFYDTYNLVAGIDGQDEYRDQVTEKMTQLQILEAQGQARIFRDLYTDAWKTPSMTIIN